MSVQMCIFAHVQMHVQTNIGERECRDDNEEENRLKTNRHTHTHIMQAKMNRENRPLQTKLHYIIIFLQDFSLLFSCLYSNFK